MKNFAPSLIAVCLSLPALAGMEEPPKTNSSLPIEGSLLSERPYSLNGLVTSEFGRGSGFVAGHRNLFLTAAHVLYSDTAFKWAAPPKWFGGVNSLEEPVDGFVSSRGYFRWADYASQVMLSGEGAFSRDVALAWSYSPFIEEEPAALDLKGVTNLRAGSPSMITGYPAVISYTGEAGNAYLHSTKEETTRFKSFQGNYLYATHISTGPGNSGGPVWVRNGEGDWKAGGILVSGRPSESGLYGFTSEIKTLFKAADPVLAEPRSSMKHSSKITTSTRLGVLAKPKTIPDGRHKWTSIPLNMGTYPEGGVVSSVRISLTIDTDHRGDLIVGLYGPGGAFVLLHDGEGAGADDLVITNKDLTEDYEDALIEAAVEAEEDPANIRWQLLVQDRLTGDIAVVTRCELEVSFD